jgi:hypothetical protein
MPVTTHPALIRLRRFVAVIVLGSALGLAAMPPAEAARLRLRATMERYSGNQAYLAVYVTDAKEHFVATVQIFGDKVQYYPHLSHWMRAVGPQSVPLDGITGASVGSGRGLDATVEVADALIGAGLQLRVDAAAENIADDHRVDEKTIAQIAVATDRVRAPR